MRRQNTAWRLVLPTQSLPLMRKTFIEATGLCDTQVERGSLFRLCGRLSLRPGVTGSAGVAGCSGLFRLCGRLSLRRRATARAGQPSTTSLPLMRKTFIEAVMAMAPGGALAGLFRLCGRLSLRRTPPPLSARAHKVSSAYAEDFH